MRQFTCPKAGKREPIPVLTGLDVEQLLRWSRPTRYRCTKPPTKCLSVLTAICPGEPGLSVFVEARKEVVVTTGPIGFHSIHNVVDRGVLQAMWEELAGQVVHRDQLIIC